MVLALVRREAEESQSEFSSGFLTQKELAPDFVGFNSVHRRYTRTLPTSTPTSSSRSRISRRPIGNFTRENEIMKDCWICKDFRLSYPEVIK